MFKFILLLLIISQVFSAEDESIASLLDHPLLTKVFGLIDQLMVQVRNMQSLITRVSNMIDRIPDSLQSSFTTCFTNAWNASRIEYSTKLNEAEMIHLPKIRNQLKQAANLEEQLNIMNTTDRIITDITMNVIKPSISIVTEIVNCLKNKTQLPFF